MYRNRISKRLTPYLLLTCISQAFAYSPADVANFQLDLAPTHGQATWDNIHLKQDGLAVQLISKEALVERVQSTVTYNGPEFRISYQLPLMLQELQELTIHQFNYKSDERQFLATLPLFQWKTLLGEGQLTQLKMSSLYGPQETIPKTSTEALLEKSNLELAKLRLPQGLSFPIPGKPKPLEMRELQNVRSQLRVSNLEAQAQIPGLIPINVELKARIIPLAANKGVSVDLKSFTIANLEFKGLLLLELKKLESAQFKVNGTTITWSRI